jgi:hypothetical protein
VNPLSHFSIYCDDVDRAKKFYEAVFGWHIEPWGPPNYYLIFPLYPDRSTSGDLRERDEPLAKNAGRTYECTFSVADLRAIETAVRAHGGSIDMPEMRIDGVGHLLYFIDSEGNRVGAMKMDRR